MNDDHKISIYAMAKAALSSSSSVSSDDKKKKLTNPRMKSISLSGYDLSFVLCSGEVCEMKNITIPFNPPLESSKEAKARIIEDHYKAFDPKASWIVTEPLTFLIFITCLSLAYATHVLKEDGIVALLGESPYFIQDIVDKLFCCWYTFASTVQNLWFFTIAAHLIEGMIVAYQSKVQLKLRNNTTVKWFLLGCCVGYPITGKMFHFAAIDKEFKLEKDTKKTD